VVALFFYLLYKKGVMPKLVKKDMQTSNAVMKLSGLGVTHDQICSVLTISKPTLYKYYQEELKLGKAEAHTKVAENLFRMATGDGKEAVACSIFYLKTQAHWKETTTIEVKDANEESQRFKELVQDIRDSRVSKSDSDKSTH
tara:strand:+ start:10081 stop:10506 length:426 start_codon:yes stop_codon:yes gene_type:complete